MKIRCKTCKTITSSLTHEKKCQQIYPMVKNMGEFWKCLKCFNTFTTQSGIYRHATIKHKKELRFRYEKISDEIQVLVDSENVEEPRHIPMSSPKIDPDSRNEGIKIRFLEYRPVKAQIRARLII